MWQGGFVTSGRRRRATETEAAAAAAALEARQVRDSDAPSFAN
jgi:hypothetical protein